MRNGETKIYRGKAITKVSGNCWMVPGYFNYFDSYYAAKEAIDAACAEDEALRNIDSYVANVCGGYL